MSCIILPKLSNRIASKNFSNAQAFVGAMVQKINASILASANSDTLNQKISRVKINQFEKLIDSFKKSKPYKILDSYKIPKNNRLVAYSFVGDLKVAEDIVNTIINKFNWNSSIIVEGNPGPGYISCFLAKKNVKPITILQPKSHENKYIKSLLENDPDIFTAKKGNILTFSVNSKAIIMDLLDRSFNSGETITIVGVVLAQAFVSCLVKAIIDGNLSKKINAEFFIVMSENVLLNLTTFTKAFSKFNVFCLFNLLFQYEILAEYPRPAIYPPSLRDDKVMYLVKIEHRKNSLQLTDDDFALYLSFLKILEKSRRNFIIQTLEKWIPDCGPYLIAKGIRWENQVVDLTPEESVKLFYLLKECEGFANFKTIQPIFESGRIYFNEPEDLNADANVST